MTWSSVLSHKAEKQFLQLPADIRKRVGRSIDALEEDPFQGNVKSLKGKSRPVRYRKRVGQYRIIFTANKKKHLVEISAILPRSEKTYR